MSGTQSPSEKLRRRKERGLKRFECWVPAALVEEFDTRARAARSSRATLLRRLLERGGWEEGHEAGYDAGLLDGRRQGRDEARLKSSSTRRLIDDVAASEWKTLSTSLRLLIPSNLGFVVVLVDETGRRMVLGEDFPSEVTNGGHMKYVARFLSDLANQIEVQAPDLERFVQNVKPLVTHEVTRPSTELVRRFDVPPYTTKRILTEVANVPLMLDEFAVQHCRDLRIVTVGIDKRELKRPSTREEKGGWKVLPLENWRLDLDHPVHLIVENRSNRNRRILVRTRTRELTT